MTREGAAQLLGEDSLQSPYTAVLPPLVLSTLSPLCSLGSLGSLGGLCSLGSLPPSPLAPSPRMDATIRQISSELGNMFLVSSERSLSLSLTWKL